jgi:hypothetical protein
MQAGVLATLALHFLRKMRRGHHRHIEV